VFSISYNGKNKKILWQEMWRSEFEDVVDKNPILIVPTGSIEQHGPHCPSDVDISAPFHIAMKTAESIEDFPVIVLPPVWFGLAHYNMGFAGTISVSADTYRNLLKDICRSVYSNGFRKIILLNGHGGNHALNKVITQEISIENIFLLAISWWELVRDEMIALSSADGGDVGHGGEWETSVQLHLRSQLILKDKLVADTDLSNPFSAEVKKFLPGWGAFAERRRDTKNHTGVMGNPLSASAEKGKKIFESATQNLEKIVREYHELPVREYREFGSYCP
jgi:creatinine amidohydrolase